MMPFALAIATGVLVGWLRGGSLDALGRSGVRLLWPVPLALAGETYIAFGIGRVAPPWLWALHVSLYVLLLVTVVANWRRAGIAVIGLGLLMNVAVIASNGGLMPEAPETLHVKHAGERVAIGEHLPRTKDVVLPRDQTRLWWLGDVLVPPAPFPLPMVLSAGDLVVAVGLAWTVMGLMRSRTVDGSPAMRPASGGDPNLTTDLGKTTLWH